MRREVTVIPSNRMLRFVLSLLFPLLMLSAGAQEVATDLPDVKEGEEAAIPMQIRVRTAEYKGDSIPFITYPTLYKYAPMTFRNERERENFNRLVRNVKKCLPLAKMVRLTILETYEYLGTLPDEKSRKAHIDAVEAGLKREYTPVLKKMSRSQGKLLVKLVDRECNMSGLNIAQAFIGAFRANLYQSIGWIFGINLNKKYDPEGDDRYTERVVRLVESGQI